MNIEWNPHIVENIDKINRSAVDKLTEDPLTPLTGDIHQESVKKKTTKFLQKYDKARKILYNLPKSPIKMGANVPLAYRLEPRLSDITDFNKDVLALPKFGGIPDMTWWFGFAVDYGKMEGKETQKLDETIKKEWPICGCCHKPLWFLGQLNITEWSRVIHLLTYEDLAKEEHEGRDRHYSQISGLGSGDKVGFNLNSHDIWWYFFYCDCFSYDIGGYSAVVLAKHKFQGFKGGIPDYVIETLKKKDLTDEEREHFESLRKMYDPVEREKSLWPVEDYRKAVEKFMEENKIHPEMIKDEDAAGKIPLQFVNDFDIHFDIDFPGVIHSDLYEALYYGVKKTYNDIFGDRGTYQLFGRPHSQQEEPRYMCSYGHDQGFHGYKLHRLAPLICWDDNKHDMTRQMYGCPRCMGENNTVWAKMDHSCT